MHALNFPPSDWQLSLKRLVTEPGELLALLELPADLLAPAQRAAELFPLRVPREFVNLMQRGKVDDPLLKQILPLDAEFIDKPGYVSDPLDEGSARPVPGVVHKYSDRVLLILSSACAINCRYCFRRHFPYSENRISGAAKNAALDYIREHEELREVILSGGDPLVTSDARLADLIADLEAIPHIERVRIHSRLPVVIPSRITERLTSILTSSRLQTALVLHINHPQEISRALEEGCQRLRRSGVTLLNQAVILKGVNNCAEVQVELSRALYRAGVLPYYLFLFDPVKGASHFDIPESEARQLATAMQAQLPGYLMPRLAQEIPGRPSKTLILPSIAD